MRRGVDRRKRATGFRIPERLQLEHAALHGELVKATQAAGGVGEAARGVATLVNPHFEKEEDFALPPLGILSALAEGRITPEMGDVLKLTDRLRSELPRMREEHVAIVAALKGLTQAAKNEGKPEYVRFCSNFILHMRTEEEVLYPAAVVLGEYLKLVLTKGRRRPSLSAVKIPPLGG